MPLGSLIRLWDRRHFLAFFRPTKASARHKASVKGESCTRKGACKTQQLWFLCSSICAFQLSRFLRTRHAPTCARLKNAAYTCKQNTLNFLPHWTIRPSMVIFRGNTDNAQGSPSPLSRDWIPPIKKLLEDYLVTRPELHLFYLWLFVHWRSLRRKVASAKREL